MAALDELKNILAGPHEYRNGQYVSTVPTPEQVVEAAQKAELEAAAAKAKAIVNAKVSELTKEPKEPKAK